jgi:DNA-binding transcriptional LysR family regulator
MIETYLLEQFVAVADCGTLLKASEALHVSQPSLSRSMRKIEDEFGVPLFHRENSKLTLNETGKVAAEYARRVLDANREMIDRVISFNRAQRTVFVGSCAPLPINEIMPVLQERLPGKTISTELAGDERLIAGLKNRSYQLVILHEDPNDPALFCQRFLSEQLYLSISGEHPLAKRESVTMAELRDLRILVDGNVGFWMDVCLSKLSRSNLLIQTDFDAFSELVESSSLPFFNSDQFIAKGYETPGRVSVPISDPETNVTYRLACLASEQKTYRPVFHALRGSLLRG